MTFVGSRIAAMLLAAVTGSTAAPPAIRTTTTPAGHHARHAVYLEAFGKGGLWGLGYAYAIDRRFSVGAVASLVPLDGERVTTLAPSLSFYPLATEHHRWFVDAGPQLVRLTTPSPVPEWKGATSNGIGAQLSTGYEYRHGVLLRVFAMIGVGKDGVAPWFGADLGWTL